MNIHDARARYTRQTIREQFLLLLQEKPVSKITVSLLCERCEINRTTFYKHYVDVYDLQEKLEAEEMERITQMLSSGEKFSNLAAFFVSLLTAIREGREAWWILGSSNGNPRLLDNLFAREEFIRVMPGKSKAEQLYLHEFIAKGCGGVTQAWLEAGAEEPVEEVAALLEKLVKKVVS